MTTPERTWCDLASLLVPGQESHLVTAGDYLVTPPWTPEGRVEALSSVGGIQRTVTTSGRFKGVRLARTSLPLIRVGADSVPETLLRLSLVDAGLPEPELQVLADPEEQWSPAADLGYRQWKIAMQHDGAHHRTPEQQERDARRDAWFQAHGWMVIRVTAADIRDGYTRVIALVKGRARAMAAGRAA
ncbi:DUF559 domain-containing protein [Cellulosimicrobium funkei]|nr:DUF559 domain-containing protein [Cellulosimicrobium funkei]